MRSRASKSNSKTVKENIALLEEAFLNLNSAQTVPLTEEEMTYYIQENSALTAASVSSQLWPHQKLASSSTRKSS